jgi:DNA-binding IclR family transcriptional regulator
VSEVPVRTAAVSGQEAGHDEPGVRSVHRALEVLSLLTVNKPAVTVREIMESTGLPRTTVLRLVHTLESSGLLWASRGEYRAGPGLWRWAHLARSGWQLPPETTRMMLDLAARYRETVNLYLLRDACRVCVAQQESPQPLRHVVHVGDELPLWAGASAKILLRHAPDELLTRVARLSPHGEGHADTLRHWIREAARVGYATSHGEREDGLSAVAVPVYTWSGAVVAALTISGPTLRFTAERVAEFAAGLEQTAGRMSEHGFSHPLSPAAE